MAKPPFGTTTVRAVGIAWYLRQDYPRILAIMEDADLLPASYDQWRKQADSLKRQAERSGQMVVEATIDPNTFPGWCAARGLNVDAKARMAFANEEAFRRAGTTH